ncbi:Major Facilitator Superfamily [Aspergillus sclerotialis]|uniref:Major Facilitator Superfamily n=1 Tax=Aspergillus sclerotialis TaxID=2070753 RepID=A0A3A2Z6R4_9EURO|nr:Major Facilitator Superfamily [Aspergillus sclerotialis]
MAAFFAVLSLSIVSDRLKARGPIMAAGCAVAAGGYIMLLATEKNSVRYAGTFLAAVGVFPGSALVMGWLSNNLAPHYVRATGLGVVISLANCSSFAATFIYLEKDAPEYVLGHSISLGSLVLCFLAICIQDLYLHWENRKRERGDRDDRLSYGNEEDLGNRHPGFKYTL